MATIADYKVITDKQEKMVRGGTNFFTRKFNMPNNFNRDEPAIIVFMVDTDEPDHLHYILRINGQDVASYTHNTDRFGTFHEVFDPKVMHPGDNDFTAVATEGDGTIKLSDVFIHFQVNVPG
jgi:hypothetical protein